MSEKPWYYDESDDDDFCEHGMPLGMDCDDCDEEDALNDIDDSRDYDYPCGY